MLLGEALRAGGAAQPVPSGGAGQDLPPGFEARLSAAMSPGGNEQALSAVAHEVAVATARR